MDSEHFEVQFLSSEQDFIYSFGVNRGHTLSFSKINRCYFLSAEAKQLYHNICDYAWGSKRVCNPSQSTLRAELGWGRHSMDKYLNELRDAELVVANQPEYNKPLVYRLTELHKCSLIIHSEIVHQVRESLAIKADTFSTLLQSYRNSEVFEKITDPVRYADVIKIWFQHHLLRGVPVETPVKKVEGVPNPVGFPKSTDIQAVSDLDSKKKGKATFDPDDAETWNSHQFTSYFQDLYRAKYEGAQYQQSAKDIGQIARLVRERAGEKEALRDKMDDYFILDFFNPKTLAAFCSSYSQSVLDEYAKSGKLPSFKPQEKSKLTFDTKGEIEEYIFENERNKP